MGFWRSHNLNAIRKVLCEEEARSEAQWIPVNGFKILLIALCMDPAAITDLKGARCVCTLQNFGGGAKHNSLGRWEMFKPPLQLIYKKTSVTKLSAFQTHKNILVHLYALKELFPARISSGQGGEKQTAQANICFALPFLAGDLGSLWTWLVIPWECCHAPLYILSVYLVLVLFCTLADITNSHSAHITVLRFPLARFFSLWTQAVFIRFLWKEKAISLS